MFRARARGAVAYLTFRGRSPDLYLALASYWTRLKDGHDAYPTSDIVLLLHGQTLRRLVAAIFSMPSDSVGAAIGDRLIADVVEHGVLDPFPYMWKPFQDGRLPDHFPARFGRWIQWMRSAGKLDVRYRRAGPGGQYAAVLSSPGGSSTVADWVRDHQAQISGWLRRDISRRGPDGGAVPIVALSFDDFVAFLDRCGEVRAEFRDQVRLVGAVAAHFAAHPDAIDALWPHLSVMPAETLLLLRQRLPPAVADRFFGNFFRAFGPHRPNCEPVRSGSISTCLICHEERPDDAMHELHDRHPICLACLDSWIRIQLRNRLPCPACQRTVELPSADAIMERRCRSRWADMAAAYGSDGLPLLWQKTEPDPAL